MQGMPEQKVPPIFGKSVFQPRKGRLCPLLAGKLTFNVKTENLLNNPEYRTNHCNLKKNGHHWILTWSTKKFLPKVARHLNIIFSVK